MPIFQDANRAVVEAAYYSLDVNATTPGTAVPTTASDGVAILGTSRCIAAVKPQATQTVDIEVYWYNTATGLWFLAGELTHEGIAGDNLGDSWKVNIGGADRIYLRQKNLSGGTLTAYIFTARI